MLIKIRNQAQASKEFFTYIGRDRLAWVVSSCTGTQRNETLTNCVTTPFSACFSRTREVKQVSFIPGYCNIAVKAWHTCENVMHSSNYEC